MGALVSGGLSPFDKVILAAISGSLITGAANTINDCFDLDIDAINKPNRPLAAGLISTSAAKTWSFILFALGIALSFPINIRAIAIAILASSFLFLYSSHLKRTVLWGNLTVSMVAGLAFIYGGVAVNSFRLALIPAVLAFFFHLGRELLKDIEDMPGDLQSNLRTFPLVYGRHAAQSLITVIFLLLILLTFIPYVFKIYGVIYLIIVIFGVDLFLIYVLFSMWREKSGANLHRLNVGLKLDMIVGLAAILAGARLG